ncbi:MAG: BNR-4 repeat-containing protein, partial [Pirellulales bacterium]
FNYHPQKGGLNARTNLYYLQTLDAGRTWQNAAGQDVAIPLDQVHNAALVRDYESEGLLVYLKQLQFDAHGRPLILYQTSRGYEPGPKNDPRTWRIARFDGQEWEYRDVTTSDHNYDFGSLYLEADGTWRLIAPTDPGAQPFATGGQMVMWTSRDEGRSWQKIKPLTHDARLNHSFARQPLNAHPDFYALWGDGDTRRPSESSLYFTDRAGTHVWRLPQKMDTESAQPTVAW